MNQFDQVIGSIEQAEFLEEPSIRVSEWLSKLYPGVFKDIASGTPLGHPAHPMLTDLPIGFWVASLILDLVGGKKGQKGADKMVLAGIVSALPTAWTGISEWADCRGKEMRVGTVHGLGNIAATLLYTGSYLARKKGERARGVRLGILGAGALTGAGFLGGHLAYRLGVGVDQTVFQTLPEEWAAVMAEDALLNDEPAMAEVNGIPILVYRSGSSLYAIGDRCSHRAGPLHEGKVDGYNCVVTCPWHASQFSLRTGEVVRGPASAPQPCYDIRSEAGQIQVRAKAEG
jgi:nitrite reductase/ring-hydroxylating ferredoxin subunit/uncharacterized membrane protein